jgi:hypothetical protein
MTEQQWLAGKDLDRMLSFLRGRASERKLRLFACACCRRVWHLIPEGPSRKTITLAEQVADGLAAEEELEECGKGATAVAQRTVRAASWSAVWAGSRSAEVAAARAAAQAAAWAAVPDETKSAGRAAWEKALRAESGRQALLLRDLFGNPFRPPPPPAPAWLSWEGGTVVRLARRIYDTRDFGSLPVLADALEEAGCTAKGILDHCRHGGEHARGCHVVDALLGKS